MKINLVVQKNQEDLKEILIATFQKIWKILLQNCIKMLMTVIRLVIAMIKVT